MFNVENVAISQRQVLTPEIEKQILSTITRQGDKVLRALYQNRFSNKELALNVEISTSALANILQKLKTSQLGLLTVEQDGRKTYYSLSEIGNQYVEKYLVNNSCENKVLEFDSINMSRNSREAISKLHEIQIQNGENWQLTLDEFLISYQMAAGQNNHEGFFGDFLDCLKKLIIEEDWNGLNIVYKEIECEVLIKRIERIFQNIMGIKSLCILDDKNWKIAYEILDDFFQYNRSIRIEFLEKLDEYKLTGEDLNVIYNVLQHLVDEVDVRDVTKKDMYEKWGEMFATHERLLYYFVEKCSQRV